MPIRAARSAPARHRTIGLTLSVVLLAAACGATPASRGPVAAPPTAVKAMPPIPDLSKIRTFTEGIPGLPADKTGLLSATLQRLGDLKYPPAAWDQGLQGWAVYDFVVAADGTVDPKYVRLVAASDDIFAKPAEDAVHAARFAPAVQGSRKVPTLVRLPVYFSLDPAGKRR